MEQEQVNHPLHYGGKDNIYEVIKVIEAWQLDFHLGLVIKYIPRAGKKSQNTEIQDLQKALWYLQRKIELLGGFPQSKYIEKENVKEYFEKELQLVNKNIAITNRASDAYHALLGRKAAIEEAIKQFC